MADIIYQNGFNTNFGADGRVNIGQTFFSDDGCCPQSLCELDPCALACAFIELLPEGPMWNYHKAKALDYYNNSGTRPCEEACPPDFPCPSLVQHSVYTAFRLYDLLSGPLYRALMESDPFTAIESLDQWLETFGWQDCYDNVCRDFTVYPMVSTEIMGACGPIACDLIPQGDECLTTAIKYGLVQALARLDMFVMRNLDSINWVLEPLNAVIAVDGEPTEDCACADINFTISPISNTMLCPDYHCKTNDGGKQIQAWYEPECIELPTYYETLQVDNPPCLDNGAITQARADFDFANSSQQSRNPGRIAGLPDVIWPGLITAECLFRSMMPRANFSLRTINCELPTT